MFQINATKYESKIIDFTVRSGREFPQQTFLNITLAPKGSPPDLNFLRTNEIPMNNNRTEKVLKLGKDKKPENVVTKNDSLVPVNNEVNPGDPIVGASSTSTASRINLGLGLLFFILII